MQRMRHYSFQLKTTCGIGLQRRSNSYLMPSVPGRDSGSTVTPNTDMMIL